ncbi:DUF6573 family protein [Vreelandella neptunia]|uniref:Uncharacterized protein n=1 Tax=Vreelandella neptunia TaxID=115551 RepID=A0ABS9SBS7_9GAMM|nr:DUF6573 family protein [Halomonas neptunia]MCH4813564.1 hypothetical protein [Halomonas neptunia]
MFDEIDMIHSYSRADAIEDGNLVDVSERAEQAAGNMMGFKVPVAMTAAAWEALVAWHDGTNSLDALLEEEKRLDDVLLVALEAAAKERNERCINFIVDVMEKEASDSVVVPKHVVMIIGPGDTPEPVITIMLPEED